MTTKFNPFDSSIDINNYSNLRTKFFNSFGTHNIYCYNNNPKVKLSGMNHETVIDNVLSANIKSSSDAYFYVNGHRKKDDVKEVRACYIDLDAGRNEDGQYLRPRDVEVKKKHFLKLIESFPVKPSWVLDTRNGYQVYWVLSKSDHNSGITKNKQYWNGIQKKLANRFDADIRAMKINQIFRIPFTWWRKPWENKKSYFSTLLDGYDGSTVNIADLRKALEGQSAQVHVKAEKSSDAWYEKWRGSSNDTKEIKKQLEAEKDIVLNEDDEIPDYNESDSNSDEYVPSEKQLRLLHTVVDFLNQASTPLYFSNNKFLSSAAKDLASKLSDEFCVG